MSTALYRRYRPETFAEVIGQDHVTGPLRQALRTGRVTHAYLFSGPRGCGKTTSARILARTLNCARNTPDHPIDTPCGECESCRELARGGPGSLDVVEIDAASHNGVDDARELRERAVFAPARDRFKIFVLDEAHMVTSQGFNALLKLVEEPPEHVKFVFATTEPDKVIGTIRSRTHHYPFRLVAPDVLGPYVEELCAAEGIRLAPGVVPLVTRAGGGSVRDSLSVLDQLMAGSDGGEIDYARAVALLGYTPATLLDDVVDALAARDGASMFRVVDRVITAGHEPRRFVEDVLERLRDLIVIAVSGDSAPAALGSIPADQMERMRAQTAGLGVADLSRAADLANAALTEMTGATSPRLHLELLCARLLLPGADDGAAGLAARLDRLERGGVAAGGPSGRAAGAGSVEGAASPRDDHGVAAAGSVDASGRPGGGPPEVRGDMVDPSGGRGGGPGGAPEPSSNPFGSGAASDAPAGALTTEDVRRRWPEVLETLSASRSTWALVSANAQVAELTGDLLALAFPSEGLARTFGSARHTGAVQDAVYQTLGLQVRVESRSSGGGIGTPGGVVPGGGGAAGGAAGGALRVAPASTGTSTASREPARRTPATDGTAPSATGPSPSGSNGATSDNALPDAAAAAGRDDLESTRGRRDRRGRPESSGSRSPQAQSAASDADDAWLRGLPAPEPPAEWDGAPEPPPEHPAGRGQEKSAPGPAARPSRSGVAGRTDSAAQTPGRPTGRGAAPPAAPPEAAPMDDDTSPDDPDITASTLVGVPLVIQMLDGVIIEEQRETHD